MNLNEARIVPVNGSHSMFVQVPGYCPLPLEFEAMPFSSKHWLSASWRSVQDTRSMFVMSFAFYPLTLVRPTLGESVGWNSSWGGCFVRRLVVGQELNHKTLWLFNL